MAVTFSDEELDLFNKNGISDDDIQATVENYRSQGLDDNAIRQKVDVKLNALKGAVVTPELKGQNGETVTESSVEYPTYRTEQGQVKKTWFHPVDFAKSFVKGGIRGQTGFLTPVFDKLENKGREVMGLKPLTDYEFENRRAKVLGTKENGGAYNVGKFVGETAPYFVLPETKLAGLGTWGNRALTYGYQGGLAGELNSIAEKGWNPKENLKDAGISAVGAIALGSAVAKGGDKLARLQRARNVMKRRNTPLAERMTAEQLERATTPASQYGVADIDSNMNRQIAKQMQNNINAEQDLMNEYRQLHSAMVKKYGSIDELKRLANEEFKRTSQTGEISEIVNDYRNLIEYEKTLANAKYVNNNIKPSTTRESNYTKQPKETVTEPEPIIEPTPETPKMENPKSYVVDDVVTPETPKTTIEGTGEVTNRGLAESVMNAKGTPKEVKQAISENMPQYRVLHNNELTEQAVKEVESNFNNELSRLSTSEDFDALDYEKANQLMDRLFDLGRNEEAINLMDNVAIDATKKGQAIQALSLWSRMTPNGVVAKAQKLVRQANKKLPKKKQINLSDEQIARLRELGNDIVNTEAGTREKEIAIAQAMKATAEIIPKGLLKKVDSYRYINMLLSGKSRFKDFILTGINSADSAVDEGIANLIDSVRSGITGKPKVYGGLQPKAWGKGFKKGWNEAKEDIQLGINTARSGETGRYGLPSTRSFNYTSIKDLSKNPLIATKQLGENVLALGEDGLNYTIRVPDRAFYEGRYASSIADQMKVTEKARNKEIAKLTEKLNKTNNQSEIASINQKIEQLKQPTQDMIIQAQKEALKAVFQDKSWVSQLGNKTRELVNTGTESIQQALKLPFELPKIGDFISPFVTTPANIANIGIENTAGGIPGIRQMLTAKTPGELRDAEMLVAKNIKGLIAGGLLGEGIYQGTIKGNFGKDDYQANNVSGLKPQSLVIGNKAISLKDYPQLSIPINTYLGFREGGIPKAVANVGRAVGDISALKGIGDLMDSFKPAYPGQDLEAKDIINNIIRKEGVNLISQLIPFGGALGELRNDIDPYSREMYMPTGKTNKEMFDNTLQYAQNRLMNRLPGVSRMLPIRYNALGQPAMVNNIKNPVARVLSEDLDFGVRNYNENKTYNELAKFKESVKDTDYTGKTNVGVDVPNRSVNVNGENIKLNNKQYSQYAKDFGKINYKLKDWAVNSDEFKQMSDEEKVKYLNSVKQSAEEAVKIMQFNHEPKKKLKEYTQYILDNWYDLTSDN